MCNESTHNIENEIVALCPPIIHHQLILPKLFPQVVCRLLALLTHLQLLHVAYSYISGVAWVILWNLSLIVVLSVILTFSTLDIFNS